MGIFVFLSAYEFYSIPALLEGGDTCLHGKRVFRQLHESTCASWMQFLHSKSSVLSCQRDCSYGPQTPLLCGSAGVQEAKYPSTDKCKLYGTKMQQGHTSSALSRLVASSRSREMKFRPMPPATISSSAGGTELSVKACE